MHSKVENTRMRPSSIPVRHVPYESGNRSVLSYDKQAKARRIVEQAIARKKIFMLQGPYPSVREYLRKNGWVELFYQFSTSKKKFTSSISPSRLVDLVVDGDGNSIDLEDHGGSMAPWKEESGFYGFMSRLLKKCNPNFLWGVRRDVFDLKSLDNDYIINHFGNTAFTSKTGLCKYLKELPWYASCSSQTFYPRAYQLAKADEKETFEQDFCLTASVSLLDIVINCYKNKSSTEVPVYLVPDSALAQALKTCNKYLSFLSHEDIDATHNEEFSLFSMEHMLKVYYVARNFVGLVTSINIEYRALEIEMLLEEICNKCPQRCIDGTKNVWILKPGAKSRGRGIQIFNDIGGILKLVEQGSYINENKYVIQKYIERPLLIYDTKFDIRQWFLVTNWNPLTVWFYKDSYLRFCSKEFTLDDFSLEIHLTNNSIQKNYSSKHKSPELPEENMWTSHTFRDYLSKIGAPEDTWEQKIYNGMKGSIVNALMCCQEIVEHRKLFGADFMLSENYQPWLIEINSSPCMTASTSVTASMCPAVLEDTLKVVLNKKKDTGLFELAYKQNFVVVPSFLGSDLRVSGRSIVNHSSLSKKHRSKHSSVNVNRNSRGIGRRKKSIRYSSSDSQNESITCPSFQSARDASGKAKARTAKKKVLKKRWQGRCRRKIGCRCRPKDAKSVKKINLALDVDDSMNRIFSSGNENDTHLPLLAMSEGFLKPTEINEQKPRRGMVSCPWWPSLQVNTKEIMFPAAASLPVTSSKSVENLSSPKRAEDGSTTMAQRLEARKLYKSLARGQKPQIDFLSRRKSDLGTFIGHLSLRLVAKNTAS